MRLLKWDSHGELSLTANILDQDLPPYAILSHTWSADEDEITFADLQHGPGYYKNKAGYKKIRFCGEQARRDGVDHFWVDTCCIDKNNHSELSEAITSMYRWYQNAKQCHVYLSDVSADQVGSTSDQQPSWMSSLSTSRWFKRGWTLQELLAPPVVQFYSHQGVFLGTKRTLAEQIHEITTIPRAALYGTPPTQFPVAERWRWAYGRQTKRKEDEAYCLLGIFEVFMSLNYGEGENAFRRLEEKVSKRIRQSKPTLVYTDTDVQFPRHNSAIDTPSRKLGASGSLHLPSDPSSLHRPQTPNLYGRMGSMEPRHTSDSPNLPRTHRELEGSAVEHAGLTDDMVIDEISWDEYFHSLAFDQLHHRKSNVSRHTSGTCAWLLKSLEYEQWMEVNGLLLVRGHPGCGKSTLIKYALTEPSGRAARGLSSTLAISFFFYASGTDLQSSTQGMFRSLLYQLLDEDKESRPAFYELCRETFGARPKAFDELKWGRHDLRAFFEKLVIDCSARRTVKIFIDAVDECRSQDREELIQFFHSLRDSHQGSIAKIGIFMTSRTYPDGQIVADFQIRLEERSQDDIQKYIEKELRLPDETERSRNELKRLLQTKANGSFLWLVLVMRRIHALNSKGTNLSVIKSDVSQCPQRLDQLYEELLGEVMDEDMAEVGMLLQWICFAAHPLSPEELRVALTIHLTGITASMEEYLHEDNPHYIPNEQKLRRRVIYLSRGLVDFSSTNPVHGGTIVQFYHESIKEFMLTKGLEMVSRKIGDTHNLVKAANADLANTCLWFLSCKEVATAMSDADLGYLTKQVFFKYARDCWFLHAAEAENTGTGNALDWTCHEILSGWIRIHQEMDKSESSYIAEGSQPLHVAAQHGLISLARKLIGNDGRTTEVSLPSAGPVFKEGSQPPTSPPNFGSKTRFSAREVKSAARQSAPNSPRGNRREQSNTKHVSHKVSPVPRARAAGNGRRSMPKSPVPQMKVHKTEEIQATVDRRARRSQTIDAQDINGDTPVRVAAGAGQLDMVILLCGMGADFRLRGKENSTPLYAASSNGHLEVVRYLFEHGATADIHTTAEDHNRTPLLAASTNGHLEVVKYLVEHGADADICSADTRGCTPLCAASGKGNLEVVKYLFEHGAVVSINAADIDGSTPFHVASANGHLEIVKYLFDHGAASELHTTDKQGRTPISAASGGGHLGVVKFLFEHGADADIHTTEKNGRTPLFTASVQGHIEVVKYLYEHGADTDLQITEEDSWTPFTAALDSGHLEVVKYLFEHRGDLDFHAKTNGRTSLFTASRKGHLEVVKYLFEHGADADIHTASASGQTPLYTAADQGFIEVVRYLFEHGADADVHTAANEGWTPLFAASSRGHTEVVIYLLDHGADADISRVNDSKWTPLCAASHNGHLGVVEYLYEHGANADSNIPNKHGWTPLCLASSNGHLEVVKYLVEHGADADIHLTSSNGRTPLFAAAEQGHIKVVKFLVERGAQADIHAATDDGWTPLLTASSSGHLELVKYLFENGADARTTNHDIWTPLFAASVSGNLELVKYLFEHGVSVDVHAPDSDGWTPLCAASSKGHLEVIKYLLEHGADTDMHTVEKRGQTPLFSASAHGYLKVLEYLLEQGAGVDIHTTDNLGRTPLNVASAEGHLEVVKCLFEHGADIHNADNLSQTPLYTASVGNQLKLVEYLLEIGDNTDVHIANNDGWTPFSAAISKGWTEIVRCLYEHGADSAIHITDKNGQTPLHIASSRNNLELVTYLFEREASADIHARDNDGWTPLYTASNNGNLEVVEYLIEHGADADIHIVNAMGRTPVFGASRSGHVAVVRYLLEHGADIHITNSEGQTPLFLASVHGHLEVVKYLLEHGADIHITASEGQTPLFSASINGHLEVVKCLLEHGAEVHITASEGKTPFFSASVNGHLEVVKYLFEHGADVDIHAAANNGQTPLYVVSVKGHLQLLEYLCEHGAAIDIHTAEKDGWTPLCAASCKGHLDVVKYLFEHGADKDIHTTETGGQTPLCAASAQGHLAVVQYLFEHGADVDIHAPDNAGRSPLLTASANGHLEVVKYLFEHGADVDIHAPNNTGCPPLLAASINGHLETVKYLFEHGADADLHTMDDDGRTALYRARFRNHVEVVNFLCEHGADVDVDVNEHAFA